jgi:hypothetical protein
MMRMLAMAGVAIVALGVATSVAAQDGAGLDETLNFIRDQIAQQGQSEITVNNRDPATGQTWVNRSTQEGSNVSADAAECKINLHWRTVANGAVTFDGDGWIPFRQVDHVTVLTLDEYFAHVNAVGGHSDWITQTSPALTVVTSARTDGVENIFYFQDADLAGRVAEAMRHAAELCGATK